MNNDNVTVMKKSESIIVCQIIDILRHGARNLLAQALEADVDHFISHYYRMTEADKGSFETLICPNVWFSPVLALCSFRCCVIATVIQHASERVYFSSVILSPYLRRTKSIEKLIP